MPLISLPIIWNVIINIMAWAFFHVAISVICFKLPLDFFVKDSAWSRLFAWERSGAVWQQMFKVKKWKGRLIDGTSYGILCGQGGLWLCMPYYFNLPFIIVQRYNRGRITTIIGDK